MIRSETIRPIWNGSTITIGYTSIVQHVANDCLNVANGTFSNNQNYIGFGKKSAGKFGSRSLVSLVVIKLVKI